MQPMVLDFSFSHPAPTSLRAAGVAGVMRYLSYLPNGKVITKAEYEGYRAAAVAVGLVWEQGTSNYKGGHAQGLKDGTEARRQAGEIGFPFYRPIYAAYDTNVPRSDFALAGAYQGGFARGAGNCGCYAEGDLGDFLMAAGLCGWFWEVNATSWLGSSYDHGDASLVQRTSHHYPMFPAGSYDESTVQHEDWGQDVAPIAITPPVPLSAPHTTQGEEVDALDIEVTTDATGAGWVQTDVPWDKFRGAYTLGSAPARDHVYWHGEAHGNDTDGKALISVVFCPPNATAFVRVNIAH